MTRVGTLPLWAMFLIGSVVLSFILGFFNPYISKATLLRLENVDKEDWSKPRPTIRIKERFPMMLVIVLILLTEFVAFIAYMATSMPKIIAEMGGGFISMVIAFGAGFVTYCLTFFLNMVVYVVGLEITTSNIRRHYERQYGAKIEREP